VHADLSGGKWPKEPTKVLVVDADSQNVRALVAAFRSRGREPLEATSFEAAKRLWIAEQPPMLIADIRLGQFNGLPLLLRAKGDRPDVVAAITCATPDAVLQADTRRFGGRFFVKPMAIHSPPPWYRLPTGESEIGDSWSLPIARQSGGERIAGSSLIDTIAAAVSPAVDEFRHSR